MEDLITKLQEAIAACADKAAAAKNSVDALQYTQAAMNASSALIGLRTLE